MSTPTSHTDASRLLYDRKTAARQLSISVRSLDYLVADKKLRVQRQGKKVMIPHAELVRYASANSYAPMTPPKRRRSPAIILTIPAQTWA